MAKVFFAVKDGKLIRNNKNVVAEVTDLDTTPKIVFAETSEEATFQEYVAGLKKMGKEAPGSVTPEAAVINLSKLLLADGREKPYLKQRGVYGEYTPKQGSRSEKKAPKTDEGKPMSRSEVQDEFINKLVETIKVTPGVSDSLRVIGDGLELAYKGQIFEIYPKFIGKM